MISAFQHFVNLIIAAAISAALIGVGLDFLYRGRRAAGRPSGRRPGWVLIVGGLVGVTMTFAVAQADRYLLLGLDDRRGPPWKSALLVAGMFGAGLATIGIGLRGRRVGDHPYCRACGFDLFGRPAGGDRCNECGADTAAPSAVVVGTRRRRRGPMLAGLFFCVLAVGLAAPVARDGRRWATSYNWAQHKPASWLLAEARAVANVPAKGNAYGELLARAERGALDATVLRRCVDDLLARPGWGKATTWSVNAEEALRFAVEGWRHGALDEATVRRALQANLELRLVVATKASRGRVVRYHVAAPDDRLVHAEAPFASIRSREVRLSVKDRQDAVGGVALPAGASMWSAGLVEDDHWMALSQAGNALRLDGLPADRQPPAGPAAVEVRLATAITMAIANRPTLAESRDVVLNGNTVLVDPAAMRCPPATQPFVVHDARRLIDADTYDDWSGKGQMLYLNNASDEAILGDAYFVEPTGAVRPFGPILARPDAITSFPCPDGPRGSCFLVVRARPDLGAELFRPASSHHVDLVIRCNVE